MKLLGSGIATIIVIIIAGWIVITTGASSHDDDELYGRFVTIKGTVTLTESKIQKTSIPAGMALVFQRVDCKACLAVAVTDENGEYRLRVGKGKYRLVVRNCGWTNEPLDCMAPDQPRIADANNTILPNDFDVKLVRPANSMDEILPVLNEVTR